jgi:hypothetical protein
MRGSRQVRLATAKISVRACIQTVLMFAVRVLCSLCVSENTASPFRVHHQAQAREIAMTRDEKNVTRAQCLQAVASALSGSTELTKLWSTTNWAEKMGSEIRQLADKFYNEYNQPTK